MQLEESGCNLDECVVSYQIGVEMARILLFLVVLFSGPVAHADDCIPITQDVLIFDGKNTPLPNSYPYYIVLPEFDFYDLHNIAFRAAVATFNKKVGAEVYKVRDKYEFVPDDRIIIVTYTPKIILRDPDLIVSGFTNLYPIRSQTSVAYTEILIVSNLLLDDIYRIALHELGHAIGLAHDKRAKASFMHHRNNSEMMIDTQINIIRRVVVAGDSYCKPEESASDKKVQE